MNAGIPLRGYKGFVDGPNLYAYVRQNPWTKFDPEGLTNKTFDWIKERAKETGEVVAFIPQGIAMMTHMALAGWANFFHGGKNSKPASDRDATASQLYYQWVFGKGPRIRRFDGTSLMAGQMMGKTEGSSLNT